jgi:hypothetical protein
MFKPFFSNPFPSLATRSGVAIGKALERTMLDAVGDRNGFLKRFSTDADGRTTMLQTRGGMPHFSNVGSAWGQPIKSVSDGIYGDGFTTHTVLMVVARSRPVTVPLRVKNTGTEGIFWYELGDWSFSDWVTISLTGVSTGSITIPPSVVSFTVDILFSDTRPGKAYQLTVGNKSGFYAVP